MRVSSLGIPQTVARQHMPRSSAPPAQESFVIEYDDTLADVMSSRLILLASVAVALAVVCFDVAFLISY
jgi:hypothetical protein